MRRVNRTWHGYFPKCEVRSVDLHHLSCQECANMHERCKEIYVVGSYLVEFIASMPISKSCDFDERCQQKLTRSSLNHRIADINYHAKN